MRTKEREVLKKSAASHNDIIDFKAAKLVSDLNHATSTLDYVFDLNCVIRESKEALFTNHWIHVNAKGNALCADYVARILQERGLLG